MTIYYRVIGTIFKTKQRWEARQFTSTHKYTPLDWSEVWEQTKSENVGDYKRDNWYGRYSERAVQFFIDSKKRGGLTAAELAQASELEGVCAWTTPQRAWEHAVLPGHVVDTWIIEFEGTYIAGLPEQDGGVQVQVDDPGTIYTAAEFAERHNLPLPEAPA